MEAMVSELLELERMRQGRGLELRAFNLVEIARDVVQGYQGRAPGVVVQGAPDVVQARVDGEKVRRVLSNLIDNAIKYALPDSGPVRVLVEESAQGATVVVEDEGAGIPEEHVAKLFEPFYRVDRSRSRKTGGYGLGLSLCKRIMVAHGGDVVYEKPGHRGARFVLRFARMAAPGTQDPSFLAPPGQ